MSAPKSWLEMSKEAIVALKDRTGSSMQAIKAYIMKAYPTINFQQHMLRQALKKGAESGKVREVRMLLITLHRVSSYIFLKLYIF